MRLRKIRVISRSRLGYRGAFLLGLAVLDIFYGMSFLKPDEATLKTSSYLWRDQIFPSPVWGALWIGAGLVIGVNAFLKQDRIGYGLAIAIKLGWAFMSLVSWLTGHVHTGWVAAVIWGVFGWVTISESLRGEPVHSHEVTFIDPEDSRG